MKRDTSGLMGEGRIIEVSERKQFLNFSGGGKTQDPNYTAAAVC